MHHLSTHTRWNGEKIIVSNRILLNGTHNKKLYSTLLIYFGKRYVVTDREEKGIRVMVARLKIQRMNGASHYDSSKNIYINLPYGHIIFHNNSVKYNIAAVVCSSSWIVSWLYNHQATDEHYQLRRENTKKYVQNRQYVFIKKIMIKMGKTHEASEEWVGEEGTFCFFLSFFFYVVCLAFFRDITL